MIDLKAIKARIEEADELREVSIGEWPPSGGVGADAVEDRRELVAEIERLRKALEAQVEYWYSLPCGIDEDADPDNPSSIDAVAHIGGLAVKAAR